MAQGQGIQNVERNFQAMIPRSLGAARGDPSYRFYTFCHPRVCDFLRRLDEGGLGGLLHWNPADPVQNSPTVRATFFKDRYAPEAAAVDLAAEHVPLAGVDFSTMSPYGLENQNIFFFLVLRATAALTGSGQFIDADWLLRSVFDPADGSSEAPPLRFWKYQPFRDAKQQLLGDFLALLNGSDTAAQKVQAAVQDWIDHPFEPWRVASQRTVALMKTTVRYYVENLVAQADQDYARATDQEMLLRAAAAYVRALEILGPTPQPLVRGDQADDPSLHHTYQDFETDPTHFAAVPEALELALPQDIPTSSPPADRFPFT